MPADRNMPARPDLVGERDLRAWLVRILPETAPQLAVSEGSLLFEALADAVQEGVLVENDQGQIVYANRQLAELVGISSPLPDRLTLDACLTYVTPDTLGTRRALAPRPEGHRFQVSWVTPTGTTSPLRLRYVPFRDSMGRFAGGMALLRPVDHVTPVYQSPDALETVLGHSRDCLYLLNLETKQFDYVSPASRRVTGIAQDQLMRDGWEIFFARIHTTDQQTYRDFGRRLLSSPNASGSVPILTYRFRHTDGRTRWISESAAIIRDASGAGRARVGALRDITESKLAETAILSASRMSGTAAMAGGVGHDFNNLMAIVLSNVELLRMRLGAHPEAQRLLGNVLDAARQAGHLGGRMMAYARGGDYVRQLLNLNDILENVLCLKGHFVPKGVELAREGTADLWQISADPAQMEQVITNLTLNAVEAMPDGGALTVRTMNTETTQPVELHSGTLVPGRYVRLQVSDTGCGMGPETVFRIFEPFYSTKQYGRGLGLSSVLQIVKEHNGGLDVETVAGQGSTFSVYLATPVETREERAPLARKCEEIAIYGQDAPLCATTKRMLDRLGYSSTLLSTPTEVQELARKHAPRACILMLPHGVPDTFEHHNVAAFRRDMPDTRVLVIASTRDRDTVDRILDAGGNAYLALPFRLQDLGAKLEQLLGERRG